MLSVSSLASRPEYSISAVTCRDDHVRWSGPEVCDTHRVVLVRRGRFRRRVAGTPTDVDATVGYVGLPDEEEHFAHPAGGDECTSISLTPDWWRDLAGESPSLRADALYIDARLDLAHRRVLAAVQGRDADYALSESLLGLLAATVGQVVSGPTPAGATRRPLKDERALVTSARQVISDGHPASVALLPLAELLGVSPYRLSRAFSRELGVSVTRYRNRVRVGQALDRLEQGENSLAALAADLGFADQAHLCRTVRQLVGHTPTALRQLLVPASGVTDSHNRPPR
ncbi:helix-turn-helix transcriptional regulator [Streptomyces sp. NBC_01077]|uniref:helix-turn-helix transcriptional regulator n=1 Tax=Streptomyces sp. NBC_01077 TaxID=2903746 RepID=UPI00386C551D|nr:helix-turn-helix transcriptional regulator [Streptomyces sp. NBC_01077]WSV43531.1 helix-turn-helix transcriptional regulator [Streptomyces sp. NBC_01077]